MCALRLIFLFLAVVRSEPIQDVKEPPAISSQDTKEPPSVSLQDTKEPPAISLRWNSKFSILVTVADGRQDEISLRHVDLFGGVAVPCLYQGFMDKDKGADVAVLGCSNATKTQVTLVSNYSTGMYDIIGNNSTIQIENPYKAKPANNTDEEITESIEEDNLEGRQKRSTFPLDYEDYAFSFSGSKLDPVPADVIYEMDVAYEDTFLERMGGDKAAAEQYILVVVAHTQPHLKHPSLGTRVHLNIRHKPKHLEGRRLQVHDDNFKSIQETATIQNNDVPLAIFVATDDTDLWMGVAYRRYGCDPSKARLILKHRCSVQKAAQTLGHEILHLFGNFHDEEEDEKNKLGLDVPCSNTGLMSDGMELAVRPEQWSLCSEARLQRWYTNYGKCLLPAPQCSDDSNNWVTPCLCGGDATANLCGERHTCCEAATSTCLGVRDLSDVLSEMSWMRSQIVNLIKQAEDHKTLNSQQSAEMSLMKSEMIKLTQLVKQHHPPQPAVCNSYTELDDAWRHIDYDNRGKKSTYYCDKTGNGKKYTNLVQGWYRFTGAAGSKLPTSPAPGAQLNVNDMICETHMVGWISSGGHPTIQDGIVTRDVCWEWEGTDCYKNTKTTINVAACKDYQGFYFVYELKPVSYVWSAYCALD